jgi:hypothetical protein
VNVIFCGFVIDFPFFFLASRVGAGDKVSWYKECCLNQSFYMNMTVLNALKLERNWNSSSSVPVLVSLKQPVVAFRLHSGAKGMVLDDPQEQEHFATRRLRRALDPR